jgi:hypothetical protein
MADETLKDLQARARELDVAGRSSMDAAELTAAIAAEEARLAGTPPPRTDAQTSEAALDAADETAPAPGTPDEVGRPELASVAEARAANRNPRVIGAETQED